MATQTIAQQAQRISRTALFHVQAPVEKAFPLFGPIREKEWAAGWNPEVIYSRHPEVEHHMIFKTKGNHADEPEYLWIVTQFNPETYFIEYSVSTVNRVWFIAVQCKADRAETSVTVTYSYTGLNALGNQRNVEMLDRMFEHNLKDWERAINYYLRTGTCLD